MSDRTPTTGDPDTLDERLEAAFGEFEETGPASDATNGAPMAAQEQEPHGARVDGDDSPDEVASVRNDPPTEKQGASPASGSGRLLASAALLVALIAMAAGAAAGYLAWRQETVIAAGAASASADAGRLARELTANDQAVAQLRSEVESLTKQLEAKADGYRDQLVALRGELDANKGTSSQDWLLAEVEYLIRLANQRVRMERDGPGAVAMLLAADNILKDAENLTAFDLREAVATDLTALRLAGTVDVEGVYLELSALRRGIRGLQQREMVFQPKAELSSPLPDPAATFVDWLWHGASTAATRLTQLVDFRRGEHIEPILPPGQEAYLRQNLRLKLQMAQLALLDGNQPVYTMSLDEAEAWVSRHFDPLHPVTVGIVERLGALRDAPVAAKLPDISGSLDAVRARMARFHEAPPVVGPPPP
jgi:uroporphyrin-3 C-methyltransferase